MAFRKNDDLGPALAALGALALGVIALVTLWSGHRSDLREAREHARTTTDGTLEPYVHTFPYADGGVGVALLSGTGPGLSGALGTTAGEEMDPQVLAMRRFMSRPDDAGVMSFWPYRSTGHATVARGVPGVGRDAECDLRVLPVGAETGFNCVVRVRCGGVVVYPDGELEAGYAPCDVIGGVPRTATDENPTLRDGDPELVVDLDAHIARVRDLRGDRESFVEIRLD